MILGKVMSFFYWNVNYHIEHHMYAAAPYYNLPRLHELVKDDLPPVKKGLLSNWKDIWPVVKRQRKDPQFCLVPQLPNH
jgi:fatty acid desaturase